MADLINRNDVLSVVMGLCETQDDYDEAYDKIMSIPTVPDIDRAAILRLCNEIEDICTEIANYGERYKTVVAAREISERAIKAGKELTGDAGTAK